MPENTLQVSTVLICKNPMLSAGLSHILSGTRFTIHPEPFGDVPPARSEADLFIIDASFEPVATVRTIRQVKSTWPNAKVIVLSNEFRRDDMISMLDAGSHGYCLATMGCEALTRSLELIMPGEIVFPAAFFLSSLAIPLRRTERVIETQSEIVRTGFPDRQARALSSREAEILRCLMQGAPNKVIARELDVAEATVKVHVKAILRKIQVSNRTQAAIWAAEHMGSPPQQYSSCSQ